MELSTTTTKKGRINIHADGEYQFTVPAFIWYASPLCGKTEILPEELEELRLSGQQCEAYDKALRLLGQRAHSTEELRRKLRQKYPADAVENTLQTLTENGLVDDVSFAEALAEELSRRKSYAPERIRLELCRRGIDAETAKNAVKSIDINKKEGIIEIINKLHLPERPTHKDVQRLIRRLLNAGYSMREIREVVTFSEEEKYNDEII